MLRPTFLAATLVVASACHDDPKPASVPLPATTASGVDAVQVPPATMTSAPLVIEDHRIVVNGKELLDLREDQSAGLDPKYKRNGKNDLYVVPLAASFARDAGTWPSPLTIDVDDRTSYRVLIEVLYTLGQSEMCSRWTAASPSRRRAATSPPAARRSARA